jgi:ubiquinone/menaquinone biosynthesis C-methylase UbiE
MLSLPRKLIFKVNNSKLSWLTKHFFASSGYKLATYESIIDDHLTDNSWNRVASSRQLRIWKRIIRNKSKRADLNALINALKLTKPKSSLLCEVGCGSAYLSDFIRNNNFKYLKYIGVDSSLTALSLAKTRHNLIQASSNRLPFVNNFFDIVLDGVALIHIINWQESLSEYARITSKYIILHSISISNKSENLYISKFAYSQKVSETIYSRRILLEACNKLNLQLVERFKGENYAAGNLLDCPVYSETWLLMKSYE